MAWTANDAAPDGGSCRRVGADLPVVSSFFLTSLPFVAHQSSRVRGTERRGVETPSENRPDRIRGRLAVVHVQGFGLKTAAVFSEAFQQPVTRRRPEVRETPRER